MNLLKALSAIVLISMMATTALSASNTTKEVDCTTSYRMWEVPLEDWLAYCLDTFCDCFNANKGCPPQWSKDIFDGFSMLWYFENKDVGIKKKCDWLNPDPNINKIETFLELTVKTTTEKKHMMVIRDWEYPDSEPFSRIGSRIVPTYKPDHWPVAHLNVGVFRLKADTQGMWSFKLMPEKYVSL